MCLRCVESLRSVVKKTCCPPLGFPVPSFLLILPGAPGLSFFLMRLQPVKELVREAMRLKRVPGVWFDRSQLRWACNYRDTSSPASSSSTSSGDRSSPLPPAFSKRRAQYFPVKEHGFFRARQLAIQTRRRMNERSLSSSTAAGTTVFRSSSVPSNDPTVLTARTTGKNQPVAQTTPFRKNEKAEASASSPMKRTGGGRAARTPSASPQGDKPASGQTDRPGRQLTASSLGEEENTRAPCAAQWDVGFLLVRFPCDRCVRRLLCGPPTCTRGVRGHRKNCSGCSLRRGSYGFWLHAGIFRDWKKTLQRRSMDTRLRRVQCLSRARCCIASQ